jgi:hypothetical protein
MIFSGNHTNANKETEKKKLVGNFEMDFATGEVTLNVDISNSTFEDVLFAFQECRDEFQRQIDNKEKCPFHKRK